MLIKKGTSLGVDIGFSSIKIVELDFSSKPPRILKVGISENLTDNSFETLSKALDNLVKAKKFGTKRAITTISTSSEKSATARKIFIEHLKADVGKNELKEKVLWEALTRDHIAFPPEEAIIDCQVLGETVKDDIPGIWVFFVAANRASIKERVDILHAAGLIPIAIEIDFSAILGLLNYMDLFPEDEDIAIIDIGASKTSVGIVYRRQLSFYRDISIAGNHITSQIERRLRIKHEEAEDYKFTEDLFELVTDGRDESWRANAPIESVIEERQGLYPQIRECFRYYDGEVPNAKLTRIYFFGGTSQLRNFDKLISHRLSIPVDNVNYLNVISVVKEDEINEIENKEPIFATALGLALKPIRNAKITDHKS